MTAATTSSTGPDQRTDGPERGPDPLVGPGWLEAHLHEPQVRVVEVDVSPAAYDEGHIEGAVLWNVYRDLKDARYQLIDEDGARRLFERSGITADSTVVCYGYAPALGFWLLKLLGHRDVRILDRGRGNWMDDGRPWSTADDRPDPSVYPAAGVDERIRADHRRVSAAIGRPDGTLLDVRTDAEFRGERFWPSGGDEPGGRAGHVPGAVHIPVDDLRGPDGAFRSPAELRRLFSPIDLTADDELITYCTIGGRAATAWFALTYLLGRQGVRVYDGSWAEWGRMPEVPVACG